MMSASKTRRNGQKAICETRAKLSYAINENDLIRNNSTGCCLTKREYLCAFTCKKQWPKLNSIAIVTVLQPPKILPIRTHETRA